MQNFNITPINLIMPKHVGIYEKLKQTHQRNKNIIYTARNSTNKETVTIKRVLEGNMKKKSGGISKRTLREITILQQLQSDNKHIIELLDTILTTDPDGTDHCMEVYLVYQHYPCTLQQYLLKHGADITTEHIVSYAHQILDGIAYCHSLRIIHRDIRPQNILIDEPLQLIKITGFGALQNGDPSNCNGQAMRRLNEDSDSEKLKLWYTPPEILLSHDTHCSANVDVWSIGCVLGEMLNANKPMFNGESEITQIMYILRVLGTPDGHAHASYQKFPKWKAKNMKQHLRRNDLSDSAQDLLLKMLCLNPKNRISSAHALRHSLFVDQNK